MISLGSYVFDNISSSSQDEPSIKQAYCVNINFFSKGTKIYKSALKERVNPVLVTFHFPSSEERDCHYESLKSTPALNRLDVVTKFVPSQKSNDIFLFSNNMPETLLQMTEVANPSPELDPFWMDLFSARWSNRHKLSEMRPALRKRLNSL